MAKQASLLQLHFMLERSAAEIGRWSTGDKISVGLGQFWSNNATGPDWINKKWKMEAHPCHKNYNEGALVRQTPLSLSRHPFPNVKNLIDQAQPFELPFISIIISIISRTHFRESTHSA